MMITIVDYKAGNLTSVKRALDYLKIESIITDNPEKIISSERVIFPGVGHAKSAMENLKSSNLDSAINKAFKKGTPILGICLGTQIILSHSEEGDTECLGLIKGDCIKFNLTDKSLKIPHMGWNSLNITQKHYLLKDIKEGDELYFVHSYFPKPDNSDLVFATCEYETVFPVAIGYKNLFATQFHPEKSGEIGLKILQNFANWEVLDA